MSIAELALPVPLAELGVTDADFAHPSALHGTGHVNRVICLSLAICHELGWHDLIPQAWVAAHLHDLARRHDGPCQLHGSWAVAEKLPKYLPLYERGGITRDSLPAVVAAVRGHCIDAEQIGDDAAARVSRVLKDADGLDRVRFAGLDPSRLRLPCSRSMTDGAQRLCMGSAGARSIEEIWPRAVSIFASKARGRAGVVPANQTPMAGDNRSTVTLAGYSDVPAAAFSIFPHLMLHRQFTAFQYGSVGKDHARELGEVNAHLTNPLGRDELLSAIFGASTPEIQLTLIGRYWARIAYLTTDEREQVLRLVAQFDRSTVRGLFCDDHGLEAWEALPEHFMVFRGAAVKDRLGLSWSRILGSALAFAKWRSGALSGASHAAPPAILVGHVRKRDVLGVPMHSMAVAEVVIDPACVELEEEVSVADLATDRFRSKLVCWFAGMPGHDDPSWLASDAAAFKTVRDALGRSGFWGAVGYLDGLKRKAERLAHDQGDPAKPCA